MKNRIFRETGGNPALMELIGELDEISGKRGLLARAVEAKLDKMSAAARTLFAFLQNADGPVAEEEAERALELFEIDEPVRSLANERLIRIRVTGNLREIDVYHPRMRSIRS